MTPPSPDELVIDLPPSGFLRGSGAMIGWLVGYAVILLVAVPVLIGIVVTLLRGGSVQPGSYFCGAIALLFLVATVHLVMKSRAFGRTHTVIRATPRELSVEASGIGPTKRREWRRDEIDLIHVRRSTLPVNNILVVELEVVAGSREFTLVGQGDEAELQDISRRIGSHMGIRTGDDRALGGARLDAPRGGMTAPGDEPADTIVAGSLATQRPIRPPASTRIRLDAPGAGLLTVEIPLRTKGLGWLPIVAWFLPGPRLVISVAARELSVTGPAAHRRGASSWHADEIERVGVDYLMESDEDGFGSSPYLRIFVQVAAERVTIVRVDDLAARGRHNEHELYWVADRIQRALARRPIEG